MLLYSAHHISFKEDNTKNNEPGEWMEKPPWNMALLGSTRLAQERRRKGTCTEGAGQLSSVMAVRQPKGSSKEARRLQGLGFVVVAAQNEPLKVPEPSPNYTTDCQPILRLGTAETLLCSAFMTPLPSQASRNSRIRFRLAEKLVLSRWSAWLVLGMCADVCKRARVCSCVCVCYRCFSSAGLWYTNMHEPRGIKLLPLPSSVSLSVVRICLYHFSLKNGQNGFNS